MIEFKKEKELINQAISKAPSYLHIKDDGADFKCSCCKENKKHTEVLLTFTPDKKRELTCIYCIDSWWLQHATDCGEI